MLITSYRPVSVPRPVQFLLPGNLVWRKDGGGRTVYLTFDDGPTTSLTGEILSILEQYDAKATFFCVGENVKKNPAVFRNILSAGHTVGNHTQRHLKGWDTPRGEYLEDVAEASHWISSSLFRPPYGRITRKQARQLGRNYEIIMWSLLSHDHDPTINKEKFLKKLMKKTTPGSIVVFHDNLKARENVLFMLPRYLDFLRGDRFAVCSLQSAIGGQQSSVDSLKSNIKNPKSTIENKKIPQSKIEHRQSTIFTFSDHICKASLCPSALTPERIPGR